MEYNILYFAFVSDIFGGVEQKILAQHDALISLNRNVRLFLVSTLHPREKFDSEIRKRENITVLINSQTLKKNPIRRRIEKFNLIENEIRVFSPSDTIIYMRYPIADFFFFSFLKKVSHYKVITEHQEIENTFTKGKFNGNFTRNILEFIWGKKVRTLLSGFVGVTPEISSYELSISTLSSKPVLTNGNGIDCEQYLVRQPLLNSADEIKMLFVGAGYRTHGLHRLLKSMAEFKEQEHASAYTVLLKVAGDSNEMLINKKLVVKYGLQDDVLFLGHCEGEELNFLYNWADVAVGSLGIHRKGLRFTSELKAREYYCRGIPFFWSAIDQDLPIDNPYVLKLTDDESTFDMIEIIHFVERIRRLPSHPYEMRQYAESFLDWKIKMTTLYNFFDEVFNETN